MPNPIAAVEHMRMARCTGEPRNNEVRASIEGARWLVQQSRFAEAIQLMDALVYSGAPIESQDAEAAVQVIYSALEHDTDEGERALRLALLADDAYPTVRAQILSTMATHLEAEGDLTGAWQKLSMAIDSDPGNPQLAIHEVTLFAGAGMWPRARESAHSALVRLGLGRPDSGSPCSAFLHDAVLNPAAACIRREAQPAEIAPQALRFLDLVQRIKDRPLHSYYASAQGQTQRGRSYPPELRMVSRKWHKVFPNEVRRRHRSARTLNSFTMRWSAAWSESTANPWLDLLEQEPVALDVMEILKDLEAAAQQVEVRAGCTWSAGVIEPLLSRMLQIAEATCAGGAGASNAAQSRVDAETYRAFVGFAARLRHRSNNQEFGRVRLSLTRMSALNDAHGSTSV